MEIVKWYVAVDEDFSECMFRILPVRGYEIEDFYGDTCKLGKWEEQSTAWIPLPKGTIQKILGYQLTWENEPVALVEDV